MTLPIALPHSAPAPVGLAPAAWLVILAAAILAGTYLRLDQFLSQVLIDDEWHAVHQLLQRTPPQMFREFGFADYSIPLGILYWYEAQWFGLSETAMRLPMLACGLATLVAMPLYVARRMSNATAALFAILLAISPLLVIYSRMARPYAITLLLVWIAHAAYQRYHARSDGGWAAGLLYGATATLAIWLHPVSGPFALAPLLWGLLQLRRAIPQPRSLRFVRWLALAAPTAAVLAAVLLPPLLSNPQSLTAKGGIDMPSLATFVGAVYAWLGTPSTVVVIGCIAIALYGARDVARSLPEARSAALGLALTAAAVMLTQPMWSFYPITFARYLLPIVPLLLLALAAGCVSLGARLADAAGRRGTAAWRTAFAAAAVVPLLAMISLTPLAPMLRHPNLQTQHLWYYFDFRPERHPYVAYIDTIPLSPFWTGVAEHARGSLRIAAAPFYFESYDWDAPRWERLGGQAVLPGFLTGLCVDRRWGEVPRDGRFRFRNAVHLADGDALARERIDYVIWQKPFVPERKDPSPVGTDTAHCEDALRARFGPPTYEDAHLIAFKLARAGTGIANAQR